MAMTLIAIVFVLGYFGLINNEFLSSFLIQILVMLAIPLLLYTLLVSKSFKKTCQDIGLKKVSFKIILIAIALGVVLYILNTFIADLFHIIISIFGYENLSSGTTVKLNYTTLLKEFALSAILPGICEEVLHRGIMLMTSRKYHNPRIALFTSSILFGLIHLNINQFFYATILGGLIGYVALISDSIIPCMIIHFMNNFLSTYFFYGKYFNFPLAQFVNIAEEFLLSNVLLYVLLTSLIIMLAMYAFIFLTKKLTIERVKTSMYMTLNDLGLQNTSPPEAQIKLTEINYILSKSEKIKSTIGVDQTQNSNLIDKLPLIASIILGALITITSFIWGII